MTTTPYRAALLMLGMTQSDARDFHQVSLNTIKDWCIGRSRIPPGVWEELRELYDRQTRAAATVSQTPVLDSEWPSNGAAAAVTARAILDGTITP